MFLLTGSTDAVKKFGTSSVRTVESVFYLIAFLMLPIFKILFRTYLYRINTISPYTDTFYDLNKCQNRFYFRDNLPTKINTLRSRGLCLFPESNGGLFDYSLLDWHKITNSDAAILYFHNSKIFLT